MSSLQKQSSPKATRTTESYVASFQQFLEKMTKTSEVELLMKKLKFLGMNYDPFSSEASPECQQVMERLQLTPHLSNPYQATNLILRLLDLTEERLNKLKS